MDLKSAHLHKLIWTKAPLWRSEASLFALFPALPLPFSIRLLSVGVKENVAPAVKASRMHLRTFTSSPLL